MKRLNMDKTKGSFKDNNEFVGDDVPLLDNNDPISATQIPNNNSQNFFSNFKDIKSFTHLLNEMKKSIESDTIRSFPDFFGIGENTPYTFPTWQALIPRLKSNMNYYWMNYFIVVLISAGISILISPSSLISVVILLVIWYLAFHFYRLDRPLNVRVNENLHFELNRSQLIGIATIISIFPLLIIFSQSLFSWVFLLGIEVSCLHAAFRGSGGDGSGAGSSRPPQMLDSETHIHNTV